MTALALLVVTGVLACGGGPPAAVEATTAIAGEAIRQTDLELARAITERSDALLDLLRARVAEGDLDGPGALEAWEVGIRPLGTAQRAVRAAAASWVALDNGLLAWEGGDDGRAWLAAATCLAVALDGILVALDAADVDAPRELRRVVEALATWEGSTCRT